ncbi:hypothetical protein [Ferrimicrobium sp.]|uniref:hypothetical protein n=1 Tax=Ferrimicrobium sp. TaxID=2926050 RepID=UPI00261D2228|nr:hypothetical protein [Ferrimicrobium sp.]
MGVPFALLGLVYGAINSRNDRQHHCSNRPDVASLTLFDLNRLTIRVDVVIVVVGGSRFAFGQLRHAINAADPDRRADTVSTDDVATAGRPATDPR